MAKTNYILASTPAEDLTIVEAMTGELKDYLLRDDVYHMLVVETSSGEERYQLSLGDLLSRLHRLEVQADQLSPEQRRRLEEIKQTIQDTLRAMESRALALAEREIKTRLNSLRWFLDECRDNRRYCRSEYPFEIRNRQRIQELLAWFGEKISPELRRQVAEIDQEIRSLVKPADFIWDDRVQDVYPRESYWYLYALPA